MDDSFPPVFKITDRLHERFLRERKNGTKYWSASFDEVASFITEVYGLLLDSAIEEGIAIGDRIEEMVEGGRVAVVRARSWGEFLLTFVLGILVGVLVLSWIAGVV